MNTKDLYAQIQAKKTMLCVGLDTDFNKMPQHIQNPVPADKIPVSFLSISVKASFCSS